MTLLVLPDLVTRRMIDLTCYLSAAFANAMGVPAAWGGGFVTVSGFMLLINGECTGLFFLWIYAAGVLSYPLHGIGYKIKGVLLGGVFLIVMNAVRLIVLGLIGAHYSRDVFDVAHTYLWQGAYVILLFMTWHIWVQRDFLSKPFIRFAGISIIASAVVISLLRFIMGPYLNILAVASNVCLGLIDKGMAVAASGDSVVFQHSGNQAWMTVSFDVFNSVIFFALVTASAAGKGGKGYLSAVLMGCVILFVLHLLFVLIAGNCLLQGISYKTWLIILWMIRGVSVIVPLMLWAYVRRRFLHDDLAVGVTDEKILFQV
jgi:exosortase/archaeosortase family protein